MNREQILIELQMITGVISNDIMYLYNLLISKPEPEKVVKEVLTQNKNGCGVTLDLDSWFDGI
ncbi:MAG: hypothetical protein IJE43_19210 [Alphaproteobacteria bacterium]|nr:hypothetical protein [Alphaproteobacteria bacterium]